MIHKLHTSTNRRLLVFLGGLLAIIAIACGSGDSEGEDSGYPILPTDALVQAGQPLYQQNCAVCHGDAVTRPPVSFAPTHADDGHTWHHPDRNLVEWILDGVPLATAMPEFRGQLSETEVRAVVAYIKTFWPEQIQDQQIELSRRFERTISSE